MRRGVSFPFVLFYRHPHALVLVLGEGAGIEVHARAIGRLEDGVGVPDALVGVLGEVQRVDLAHDEGAAAIL